MSSQEKQGWTSGPETRGSFDILWTCLATLALCVWTAVHPNVLLHPSSRKALLLRLAMMLIAIVFPEFIISAAWAQLRSAGSLRKYINAIDLHQDSLSIEDQEANASCTDYENISLAESSSRQRHPTTRTQLLLVKPATANDSGSIDDDSSAHRLFGIPLRQRKKSKNKDVNIDSHRQWTLDQAFFATMGGFAIENDFIDKVTGQKVILRRLVTTDGVRQLADMRLLPEFTPEDIEERSKADVIAKIFVLSQILWFGLQVLGRLAAKLPITLLETHTAIHVACTIVIYFMWLKKPYDVTRSILLSDSRIKEMGALSLLYQNMAALHVKRYATYRESQVQYWKNRVLLAANNLLDYDPPPNPPVKEGLTVSVERYLSLSTEELPLAATPEERILVALAPEASRAIQQLQSRSGAISDAVNIDLRDWNLIRDSSENFTMRSVWGSWTADIGHEMSLDKGVHFLFNFLYGGGHLAAWQSSSFPTILEQAFWRASATMLTAVPLFGCLWVLWWKAARSKRRWLAFIRNGELDIIVAPFFFIVMATYVLARSFLLVESLISLRYLPAGAFKKVEWTRYIPHIS